MSEPISINIAGVCCLRDIFGLHDDNGGYKIKRYSSNFAPLYAAEEPYPLDVAAYDKCAALIPDVSNFLKRCVKNDISRNSINWIKEDKSDYLLLDIALLRTNYIQLANGQLYYGGYPGVFEKMAQEGIIPPIVGTKPFDFVSDEELKRRLRIYFDKILEIYPLDKIILVELKNVYKKVDLTKNQLTQFINIDKPRRQDPFMKKCFESAKEMLKGCHIVYMPDNVLGDENHRFNAGALHYTQEYYDYGLKAVDLICSGGRSPEEEASALEELRRECSEKYAEMYRSMEKNISDQIIFPSRLHTKYAPKQPAALKPNEVEIRTVFSLLSNGYEREMLTRGGKYPLNAGIAAVGNIVRGGVQSVKNVNIGDRVFVEKGGHSDRIVQNTLNVIPIPQAVPFESAVFAKAAVTAIEAVRKSALELGESVVVVGAGAVGHFAVKFAKMAGAYPVICIEKDEGRRKSAERFGADCVLSPDDPDLVKTIYNLTNEKNFKKGAGVVIEASGTEQGFLKALEYTCPQGRIVLSGHSVAMTEQVNLYEKIYSKGLIVLGIPDRIRPPYNSSAGNWTAKRDYLYIFNLMADGIIDPHILVNNYISPLECEKVYSDLLNSDTFPLGVIFDWTKINKEL